MMKWGGRLLILFGFLIGVENSLAGNVVSLAKWKEAKETPAKCRGELDQPDISSKAQSLRLRLEALGSGVPMGNEELQRYLVSFKSILELTHGSSDNKDYKRVIDIIGRFYGKNDVEILVPNRVRYQFLSVMLAMVDHSQCLAVWRHLRREGDFSSPYDREILARTRSNSEDSEKNLEIVYQFVNRVILESKLPEKSELNTQLAKFKESLADVNLHYPPVKLSLLIAIFSDPTNIMGVTVLPENIQFQFLSVLLSTLDFDQAIETYAHVYRQSFKNWQTLYGKGYRSSYDDAVAVLSARLARQ